MKGVVVAPQPLAAEIGAEILGQGGNAFDAAIATAFAQMITDPQMCGLGGFGCATYLSSDGCEHVAFHARAGSKATPDMWANDFRGRTELGGYTLFDDHRSNLGHTAVGTPGVLAGLQHLHKHARLPWSELLQPAADLAVNGFPAPDYAFEFLRRPQQPGMPQGDSRVRHTQASVGVWCKPDGALLQPGEPWRQPDAAATLQHLARKGAGDFYTGELAELVANELARGGGYVTREDLRSYNARPGKPVEGRYRGLTIRSAAPPASGISGVQMLQVLDRLAPTLHEEPATYVLLASVMREAFAERIRAVGDPDFVPVAQEELTSARWADEAASRVKSGIRRAVAAVAGGEGTTHLSAYDADGNAVALTHTLGIYSGVTVPNTGIALNSAMDLFDPIPGNVNSIAPGKARVSGMAPTILFDGNRPVLVTGSPGTNAIVTSVVQVITGAIDHRLSSLEAVAAPRVHCEGGPVFVEGRVSQAARAALREAGFDLREMPQNYGAGFGRNQLITIDADGTFIGASDPRRDGGVAAYSRR